MATRIPTLKPAITMLANQVTPMPSDDWTDDRRGTRQERGYGAAWDRLRLRILARDQYLCRCQDCRTRGLVKPATEVDHIISKAVWRTQHGSMDGVDAPTNLQAINAQCHARKTNDDRKAATGQAPTTL